MNKRVSSVHIMPIMRERVCKHRRFATYTKYDIRCGVKNVHFRAARIWRVVIRVAVCMMQLLRMRMESAECILSGMHTVIAHRVKYMMRLLHPRHTIQAMCALMVPCFYTSIELLTISQHWLKFWKQLRIQGL